jgi:hypothetical protein
LKLPAEGRYAAKHYMAKVLKYSQLCEKELLRAWPFWAASRSRAPTARKGKLKQPAFVIRELMTDADWVLWGSLNRLLPTLAEAAPGIFS